MTQSAGQRETCARLLLVVVVAEAHAQVGHVGLVDVVALRARRPVPLVHPVHLHLHGSKTGSRPCVPAQWPDRQKEGSRAPASSPNLPKLAKDTCKTTSCTGQGACVPGRRMVQLAFADLMVARSIAVRDLMMQGGMQRRTRAWWGKPECSTELRATSHKSVAVIFQTCTCNFFVILCTSGPLLPRIPHATCPHICSRSRSPCRHGFLLCKQGACQRSSRACKHAKQEASQKLQCANTGRAVQALQDGLCRMGMGWVPYLRGHAVLLHQRLLGQVDLRVVSTTDY